VKIIDSLFKIRYKVYERTWPERKTHRNMIEWWRKGNEHDGYWYKAGGKSWGDELGETAEEAVQNCLDNMPVWVWDRFRWSYL
jgi:hypothetical protein